jgi:D-alanyl-D-alanine carboxypeptidase (penicillin-binding protein 5/6)
MWRASLPSGPHLRPGQGRANGAGLRSRWSARDFVRIVIDSPGRTRMLHLMIRMTQRIRNRAASLVLACTALAAVASQAWPQAAKEGGFQTSAPYAILIEADSGTVLFEKNADQPMYPSSMAKLMTSEVVFQAVREGKLKLDDEVTISENAWRKGGAPSGGSTMYAALNSRVRVDDLIKSVVIQSGNDACIALAEALSGTELQFSVLMNKRAKELGLTKSNYTNSSGLPDPDMKVTARELALLAQHIIRTYPEFYPLFAEREFTWNRIRQQNRNPLLVMGIGADGLKTGSAKDAGYGLVGSAVQSGLRLIVVVNGHKHAKERADEARKLLEWGFRGFESRLLFAEGETVGDAKLYGGQQGSVALVGNGAIRVLVPRATNDKLLARIVYTGPVRAPVEKDQPIGKLKVWRNDQLTLEVPLKAAESVPRGSVTQRAFDAATELVIGLFRAGAERI